MRDILQHDERLLVGRHLGEHFPKVGRANGEHQSMGAHHLALGAQRHIDEIAATQGLMEAGRQVRVEIVPAERELLIFRHDDGELCVCVWLCGG